MKKLLPILVALVLFMAMPMSASGAAMDIRNIVVDNDVEGNATQYAYANNMVKLVNGTLIVGYVESSASEDRIIIKFSTTNGRRWSNPIVVDDTSGDKFHVCLAVNETSNFTQVVYAKDNGTNVNIYYSTIAPITWAASTPDFVAEYDGYEDQPYIAHHVNDTLDRFVTVFRVNVAGTYVLYYSNMTGDTGSWSTKAPVNPSTPDNQSWPCLAQNLTDVLHLSFSEYNSTDSTWDLMYSYLNATEFEVPVQFNASHHNQVEGKVISSEDPTSDFMFYAWNEFNATNRSIRISLVMADDIGDGGNATIAYNGTNVSCMASNEMIRVLWINTSTSTSGEIYTRGINKTLVVVSEGRVTDDDYVYRWPSCFWYNGTNNTSLFVVTRGSSTDVMFYDFGNVEDVTTDPYAWVDNLVQLIIAMMGVFLVIIILGGMMKSFGKVGKK